MINHEEVKERILIMIKETMETLPPMIRTMAQMQFGTVTQLVNNMTDEQVETLINKVEKAVEVVKYGNTVSEHDTDK